MEEIWKSVLDFECLYEVSNFGRVKGIDRIVVRSDGKKRHIKEHIMKQRVGKCGYYYVCLSKNGKHYMKRVHKIIANAFMLNQDNSLIINHKDEDKLNNSIENLEWCTYSYNAKYGTAISRMLDSRKNNKCCNSEKEVVQYTKDGVFVAEYRSVNEVEDKNGFKHSHISECCNGKLKQAYGFVWKFKNKDSIAA